MRGWKYTMVWRIDGILVVAPTIEEALAVYKTYKKEDYKKGPNSIVAIAARNEAIIKEED